MRLELNRAKAALQEGRPVLGTMITEFREPEIVKMIAASGFDYAFLDMEHSSTGIETVASLARVARGIAFPVIVRVPDNAYHFIARVLDSGAHGVMVPRVETAEAAACARDAARFPPSGRRGYGVRGPIHDYAPAPMGTTVEFLNRDTVLVCQIESRRAVENLDAILDIEGIDCLLVGPNDLSISLGAPGEYTHPDVESAIEKVIAACRGRGIASGIHLSKLDLLGKWRDRGMTLLSYASDAILFMEGAKQALGALR